MFTASVGAFLIGLILAFAGGALGASFGGNYGFVLTGFIVLAGWAALAATGSDFILSYVAFGPFMGPHIVFAGGAAAAVYAAYKGYMDDGKDVNSGLAGLGKPDVLLMGSLFGAGAFAVQTGISKIPWFGGHTDSVALTVLLSGCLARIAFGGAPGMGLFRGSLLNLKGRSGSFMQKIAPTDNPNDGWLGWQSKAGQLTTIGLTYGLAAGGVSLALVAGATNSLAERGAPAGALDAVVGNGQAFVFGISAIIILFLISGRNVAVQHHATITAGLAAIQFFLIADGNFLTGGLATFFTENVSAILIALLAAIVFGIIQMFGAEFFARLFYARGNSHIDPPAAAIWWGNTLVWLCVELLA